MTNIIDTTKAETTRIDDISLSDGQQSNEHHGPVNVGLDSEEIVEGYWKSPRFLGSCLAIIFQANSLFFGYAIPVNLLSLINADIGPSADISLVTLINTLCQGIVFLLVGYLSDAIGRRWFLIGGQLFGVIGAIIGAVSKNINTLIGSTVFTGIAAATQLTYPLLVMEIVPNKHRGYAQGTICLLVIPSLGFGPVIGRTVAENVVGGWRFTFWLGAMVNGIAMVLFALFYFPPTFHDLQSGKTKWEQLREIDYVGFVLYAGSIVCLLLGLTWGGQTYPWSSGRIIALLVVGCLVLIGFVLYEIYMPLSQPLLPMKLFKIRNYSIAVVVGSVAQMSYYALNVLWPSQSSLLYTTNSVEVGWMSCTTGVALAIGEVLMSPIFKMGHIRSQMIAAIVGLMAFGGAMAAADESRKSMAIAFTAMTGFFVGWCELISIVMAGLVVPPETIGVAQAFHGSTRAVTATVATSIYLAIYNGKLKTGLPNTVTSYALDAGLPASSTSSLLASLANGTAAAMQEIPGVNNTILAAIAAGTKRAYAEGFSTVYLSTIAFGSVALIGSFFVGDIGKYMTSFVNKTVAGKSMRKDEAFDNGGA